MRKILSVAFIELVMVLISIMYVPHPWIVPTIVGVTIPIGLCLVWLSRNDIKLLLDPATRRTLRDYEQYKKEKERQAIAPLLAHIRGIRSNPFMGEPSIDYEKGRVTAPLVIRRSWRGHILSVAVWIANRPWWVNWLVTERIIFKTARILGYTPKEDEVSPHD